MIELATGRNITSGFYWVRTAKDLYYKFQTRLNLDRDCCRYPRKERFFDDVGIFYRGADRDPLSAYKIAISWRKFASTN